MSKLLQINNLKTVFYTEEGQVPSVDNVSLDIKKGETVAIVGESGSGKSVTALSILGLVPSPGRVVTGEILYEGKDLLKMTDKEIKKIRGNEISMIFQEPLSALNPVLTVGKQIQESIELHQKKKGKRAKEKVIQLLNRVGIPRPEKVYYSYPHTLSGGMRQRVMIAMALSCRPKLIIADEPTTALDVTTQAQILNLMKSLSEEEGTTILIITHDLGVVAEMADRVVVMYAGQVVEQSTVYDLFEKPEHPYTKGLLDCTPKIHGESEELLAIEGTVPTIQNRPTGCKFHPRCKFTHEKCKEKDPELFTIKEKQKVRCYLHEKVIEERLK
ncbi:ABC transporter ATP-binding protein [Oceanobacillus damuensis]|uniref:ABC transporter ATP-binding protein n=1 Tax=Oceanobacillus damuensis TaxID=937928 RepID=UPI000831788A|nr:ABC transporter ATP-binding protein [Oceanobacillus damuensis]